MTDAVGALRARVHLLRPTRVADEIGGVAIAWSDEGAVWAEIIAGGAADGAAYDGVASVASFQVAIRRRDDVRAGWRVTWSDRFLRVRGVRDEGGGRIELICEEETL